MDFKDEYVDRAVSMYWDVFMEEGSGEGYDQYDCFKNILLNVRGDKITLPWLELILERLVPLITLQGVYREDMERSYYTKKLIDEIGEEEYINIIMRFAHEAKEGIARNMVYHANCNKLRKVRDYADCAGHLYVLMYWLRDEPCVAYPTMGDRRRKEIMEYILEEYKGNVPESFRRDMMTESLESMLSTL